MRILHVIDYFQPLMGYQETHLAATQIERGHEVRVITSDRFAPVLYKGNAVHEVLGNRIRTAGLHTEEAIEVLRLPVCIEIYNNLWLRGLRRAITEFRPDAIHVHGVFSLSAIRLSLTRRLIGNAKLIMDEHKVYGERTGTLPARAIYGAFRLLFRRTISRNSDCLIAVTEETRDLMVSLYGISAEQIRIVPLGCDTSVFRPGSLDGQKLRESYDIPSGRMVYCYVGRISPEKGVNLLVDAAIGLLRSGKDICVLCVGPKNEEYFRMVTDKVIGSGFESRFIFLPPVPNKDLSRYYSMADAGIWPKQCSITMLEAMACGLPVIISNKSGATERVSDGENGLLYEDGSVDDLMAKMLTLMATKTRLRMSAAAREKAVQRDWRVISTIFENLYSGESPQIEEDQLQSCQRI